jgi:hypothetical protein
LVRAAEHTLDLRYSNSQAEQVSWPMPNMQDELASLSRSKYFATGSYARILATFSTRGLLRVPVYHHSRWSVHAD